MSAVRYKSVLIAVSLLCLLSFFFAGTVMAASSPVATFTEVTGEVIVKSRGSWSGGATVGMSLYADDQVATRKGAATLTFNDGSVMSLEANSNTIIEQWEEKKGIGQKVASVKRRIMLFLGKLRFKTGSLGSSTSLATPTAVCGLRGTAGTLSLAADGTPMITFTEGGRSFTIGELIDGVAEDVPTETASYNPVQWASFAANAAAQVASQAAAQAASVPTDSPEAAALQALAAYQAAQASIAAGNAVLAVAQTLAQSNPDPTIVGKYDAIIGPTNQAIMDGQAALDAATAQLEALGIPIPDEPAPFIEAPTFDVDPEPSIEDMTASPA